MYNIDREALIATAISAGKAIMEVYNSPESNWEVERKADNSPLTLADRRSNDVITRYLEQTPYPIISEEGAHLPYAERAAWQTFWLVDPLDGTKEFIKRNGEFTVNIALIDGGIPVFGVIYVPVKGIVYCGESGKGAFMCQRNEGTGELSGKANLPLPKTDPTVYNVVASRSHLSEETQRFIDSLRPEHPNIDIVSAGSSLKLCLVAEGKADIYPRFAPTMEWDTAAGHAIVLAAGGEVVNADTGAPLAYNKPDLHNPYFIVK